LGIRQALSLLIIFPFGALLAGASFAIAACYRRNILPAFAALLWTAYGVYEYLMYALILCTGECNIRVDLLMIYPVLLLFTVAGIISASRPARSSTLRPTNKD